METSSRPRILSLCSGYGGLDLAVERLTGGRTVAVAETHPAAVRVLEKRFPGAVNLGDITEADFTPWTGRVEAVAAGFPCQDISVAGKGEGIGGKRSGIWKHVARCVEIVRPRMVFLENVAVIRSRGLDVVAGDLAAIGYDLRWTCLRASDVSAPHPRDRWFGYATPAEPHHC